MKPASALIASLFAAHTFSVFAATAQAKSTRSTQAVALRGGIALDPVNLARLDPDWWRATTPTTSAQPPQLAQPDATGAAAPISGGAKASANVFDLKLSTCTPFLNMPGTFLSNDEYWKNECKAVPKGATYIKLTAGDVNDYFKPKNGKSICDMLVSKDQHMWGNDGTNWFKPVASTLGLGGSADGWLSKFNMSGDKRDTPSFWGVSAANTQTGGCCHSNYSAAGKAWAKPYKMQYCGLPQALAPICTPLTTVAASFSADKDFWAQTCKTIPMTAGYVKVAMGDSIDYFRPPTGKSYCDMLTSNDQHKWSKDGENWVTPTFDASLSGLGGSAEKGVSTSDARTKVSFWGSNVKTNTGGCCYASLQDQAPGFGKSFTLSYCEIATATPVNELVELLHSSEASVAAFEKEMNGLHDRLAAAENVNVQAAGNVSLASAGMYKLAAKATNEADELKSFQSRTSLEGSRLDSAEGQLMGAEKRVQLNTKSMKAAVDIAKKAATKKALMEQDSLNNDMWKLMDPANKDSLAAMEKRVRVMQKDANKFRKQLGQEVKTVMVTKMRRSVGRLRKVIHRLGNAGNRASDSVLGTVESDTALGADLGLDED